MRNSLLLGSLAFLVFGALIFLGTWQVQRLAWKTDLIERLQKRVHQSPIPLQTALNQFRANQDVEYRPVSLRGRFLPDTEKHLYALDQKGRPGWHIYTLMELDGGDCVDCTNPERFIYVNRGFVPYALKNRDKRVEKNSTSLVDIVGLIRLTRENKSLLEVDNQPQKNEWFWLSLREMSAGNSGLSKQQIARLVPFFADQRAGDQKDPWPRAGTTRVNPPNRHLGYVITWYGLALALLGVYGFFLYSNRRQSIEGKT